MTDQNQTPEVKALTLEDVHAIVIKQQETINAQQATIEGLKLKETSITTAKKKKLTIPTETVEVNGKEYKWAVPHFNHNRVIVTAEDAATDAALLKEIVAIDGQGILIEQA